MSYSLHVVIEGKNDGMASYPLDIQEPTVIGRRPPADVTLGLPEVSTRHAALTFDAASSQFMIEDLRSKLGTYVNAQKAEPGKLQPIALGEVIQIGRAFLKIESDGVDTAPISEGEDDLPDATIMFNEAMLDKLGGADAMKTQLGVAPKPDDDELLSPGGGGEIAATVLGDELADAAKAAAAAQAAAVPKRVDVGMSREVQEILLRRVDLAKIVQQASNDDHARQIVREQIGYVVNELLKKGRIKREQVEKVEKDAFDDILGFGPIQDLIDRTDISEIMVNRSDQIYYEQLGKLKLADRSFLSDQHIQQILRRLLKNSQRRIDESMPMVNATLPDGSRLHAIIPPLALSGSTITIRKFHSNLTVDKLVEFGALTKPMATFLELATRERQNIVVSGGTGSGKTTLLNALSSFIPDSERIVTIEDTAELALTQPHVVRLQSRPANTEGVGLVTIQNLVVEALRMRPDRVIVGECRHGEALDMLQAMNTGHDGSLTTAHSNSAADALARLETMVLMSGLDLPIRAIREQIRSAVNLIVHASRLVDGSRKITEIIELTGMEEGQIIFQPVYEFNQEGMTEDAQVIGRHRPTGYIPTFLNTMRQQGKEIPPGLFSV